jgi:hypothetical protein
MSLENEIAIAMSEGEIALRRNHLRMQAAELAERAQWLDQWNPGETPTPQPADDWPVNLNEERAAIARARSTLLERRIAAMRAEEAALLLWQMHLEDVANAVMEREREHKQPTPKPRAAMDRHISAPQLSLDDRKSPRTDTEEWRMTVELPQAKMAKQVVNLHRIPTESMTPQDHAEADADGMLRRAAKRRTTRVSPLGKTQTIGSPDRTPPDAPGDPRDLVSAATPHDLPTIAPAQGQPAARHRARAVTEPFVAALDLDGLYLKREQIHVDRAAHRVRVLLDAQARHAERDDMPAMPQQLTFRSREGDLQFFGVQGAVAGDDGPSLILGVAHWQEAEMDAFERALTTLP